ncbi:MULTISPECIES: (2Fe-2S) ferredoxin domain-containing protein [Planktothrix]|uniref:(2Fe-2S) ferredoxin domain-containing protein n=1 Tax=Planktothrix mougeotii LEGE 06226 TaxID=1828728 RepID=A0ABR9UIV6_9CYAN|nr:MULTISPECIES: (2Fe-2S) ferredoxin domain-containing protein [Planktothrix]MBD2482840.1 (2Fe-2S) ferredoxin domain-containing protein [Planktothrix sp. FACHB-1365]MBE9146382.1 (2Fe-2S) ferredoxin domain-containing protein [Planktothrix mougeotii LEGE 06226]
MGFKQVLICQNRTCHQQGSDKILALFEDESPLDVQIQGIGCLGQCGNGPMIIVLPDEVWYSHLEPMDVSTIIQQHLQGGYPVEALRMKVKK